MAAVQYGVDGALYGVQYDNGLASCTDQREKDAATRTALCQGTLRPPGETARAVLSRGRLGLEASSPCIWGPLVHTSRVEFMGKRMNNRARGVGYRYLCTSVGCATMWCISGASIKGVVLNCTTQKADAEVDAGVTADYLTQLPRYAST